MSDFPTTSELCDYYDRYSTYNANVRAYPTIIDDFFAFIADLINRLFGSESWEAGE